VPIKESDRKDVFDFCIGTQKRHPEGLWEASGKPPEGLRKPYAKYKAQITQTQTQTQKQTQEGSGKTPQNTTSND